MSKLRAINLTLPWHCFLRRIIVDQERLGKYAQAIAGKCPNDKIESSINGGHRIGGMLMIAVIGLVITDSKQTELCTYLSAILLGGLFLNVLFGWWWADPVAALVMVPIISKEGVEPLCGETCCDDINCH